MKITRKDINEAMRSGTKGIDSIIETYLFGTLSNLTIKYASSTLLSINAYVYTFLSLIVGILSLVMLYAKEDICFLVLFMLHMYLDNLDGRIARIQGIDTLCRRMLDQVFDQVVFIGMILVLGIRFANTLYYLLLLMVMIYLYEVLFATKAIIRVEKFARSQECTTGKPKNSKVDYNTKLLVAKLVRYIKGMYTRIVSRVNVHVIPTPVEMKFLVSLYPLLNNAIILISSVVIVMLNIVALVIGILLDLITHS